MHLNCIRKLSNCCEQQNVLTSINNHCLIVAVLHYVCIVNMKYIKRNITIKYHS